MSKKKKSGLSMPKITFSQFGQIIFTFKEIAKIAFRINKKYLILLFIISAFWGFSAIPGYYIEKFIIDKLVDNIGNPVWRPVLIVISYLIVLRLSLELTRYLLGRVTRYLRNALSRLMSSELSIMMAKKLAELDLETIEDPDFKDKFTKISNEAGRRAWEIMVPITDVPNYLTGFISAAGVLVLLHPLIAIALIMVSIPQVFIDARFIKKGYQLDTDLSSKHKMWGWLSYFLIRNKNFMEFKILNLSEFLSDKLKKVQAEINQKRLAHSRKRDMSHTGSLIPLYIYEFIVTAVLAFWVIVQKITIGSFQLYLRSLRSAQYNLTSLATSFTDLYENYIYVSDLVWFLNLKPKIDIKSGEVELDPHKNYSIEFKNVWFKYRKGQPWVLKNVSFNINPEENIALVGLNGSGKSTIIKLLSRFYDPQRGEILVDGINLKKLNLNSWRKHLAVLFQEFEIYPFSGAQAIGYGDVTRLKKLDEIKEAANLTGMHTYIESLPLKYKNPLDPEFEKGVRPSIGQAQRIGISRMLFRESAHVIIMDEPTSSVDPEAEEKIFHELVTKAKNEILVFVTQRFSTVRLADRIFVVNNGKISEKGTHSELLKKNGKYAKLFKLQAQGYK